MTTQAKIDEVVKQWGHGSSIGQVFAALSPEELPVDVLVADRTSTMIEVRPLPDRFAVISLMFHPDELDRLVQTGMLRIIEDADLSDRAHR